MNNRNAFISNNVRLTLVQWTGTHSSIYYDRFSTLICHDGWSVYSCYRTLHALCYIWYMPRWVVLPYFVPFLYVFSYIFTSLLIYFLTYLLLPQQTRSVFRPEVVGGDQTRF